MLHIDTFAGRRMVTCNYVSICPFVERVCARMARSLSGQSADLQSKSCPVDTSENAGNNLHLCSVFR